MRNDKPTVKYVIAKDGPVNIWGESYGTILYYGMRMLWQYYTNRRGGKARAAAREKSQISVDTTEYEQMETMCGTCGVRAGRMEGDCDRCANCGRRML